MADITEKTGNGELVTNRDQLVGVDNIESLIKSLEDNKLCLTVTLPHFMALKQSVLMSKFTILRCNKLIHIYYELGRNKKKNILCR